MPIRYAATIGRAVLNSTVCVSHRGYTDGMSLEQPVDERFAERWAAWQARGADNDRNAKRKWFIVAAIVIVSAAILGGLGWL